MSQGLLHSAQNLLASLAGLARTRLELLSTELHTELAYLAATLLGALAALLLATLGLAFAGLAIVIAAGEEHRLAAAVSLAVVFLALAAAAGWSLRRIAPATRRPFSGSLAELERDCNALRP